MKTLLISIMVIAVLLFSLPGWTQDKIILKNGSVIEGRITEYKPEGVMIEFSGGNILVGTKDIAQLIVPPPPELKKADDSLTGKKYSQAIAQYKDLLANYTNYSYPWKEDIYFALARCYIEEKKWLEARNSFNNILTEFPSPKANQRVRLGLAEILFCQGDFSKAKEAYKDIIKADSKEKDVLVKAYYYLGECSAKLASYEEALIYFLKVKLFYHDYSEWAGKATFRSGEMAEALQDWERAKWTYEELIDEYPDSPYVRTAKEKVSFLGEKMGKNNAKGGQ